MRACQVGLIVFVFFFAGVNAQQKWVDLSPLPAEYTTLITTDWQVTPFPLSAGVFKGRSNDELIFSNGLVQRSFRLKPDLFCFDYTNRMTGQQLLRAVKPEARVVLDGREFSVGGAAGQKEQAYIQTDWLQNFIPFPSGFHFSSFTVQDIPAYLNWKSSFWRPAVQPSSGKRIDFSFTSSLPEVKGIEVVVHYEMYAGLPLLVKWVSLLNKGERAVRVDRVVNEILAIVEEESAVVGKPEVMKKQHGLYVETNYAFNNAMRYDISDQTTHWKTDSSYTSQVNYNYETPCLLEIYPEKAPGILLQPGETFHSVRTHEVAMDSYDRERRGMAIRKMYRTVAPWAMANPIFMHLVSKNDQEVKTAVDQCVATGYEAVILSFGSHLNMEDTSAGNLKRWKDLADYAHQQHISIGGYSLFSSRQISDEDDVIDAATGKPGGAFFGHAPCFGSRWGLGYRDKIKAFFRATGFDIWENDGPYPGDVCASRSHPGHLGLEDSQWRQMEIQKEVYRWLNERGVYINAPDWYFLDGTHKTGIGYREVNFSLSRDQQMILNRQNIYDGTFEKTPSMGWGFVPLTRYQGGGPEAILEPLSEHLPDYEQLMRQYYGAGVQACYRGPRLYDTESCRKMVVGVIDWYKKYREILNSDIVHLRRADGRDWDGWMHVNPLLPEKGFLLLFNPTSTPLTQVIKVPVYYTGKTKSIRVREKEGSANNYTISRDHHILLPVSLPPKSYSWWVLN